MTTKMTVLGPLGDAARGLVVAMLCSAALADAQTVARLKLTVPEGRPRIGITSADLDRVRVAVGKEPWGRLWEGVLAKSERVRRGRLDPKRAFGGVGGQGVRFTMTEGLECVALHALVGKDAAAAKALSDFFEAWDPAPLEKDIAETDFMSSGEFFEGLAVVLDWTWDLLAESARARLRAIIERRARHNYDGFAGKKSWEAVIEANNPMAIAQRCFVVLTGPDPYVVVADAFVKDTKDHDYTWLLHGNADSKFDLARDRASHVSGEAALDIVPCLLDNGELAFETKGFPSADFGDHPMLRATFRGNRWLGLTVLAPRSSAETPADVKREIKGGELFVTVARGGAKDELAVTPAPNGGIAALRVIRTADGKTVAENLNAAPKPNAPPLRVGVDARVELLGVIFRLAGYSEYSRGQVKAYIDDVEKQFGPFRDAAAIKLAKRLREKRGVGFDACMGMAVHLSDAYQLGEKVPLSPRPETLDARWTVEDARRFLVEARQFVKETSFKEFIETHRRLYELTESRLTALLEKESHLEWFGEFFGERPRAAFVVAPAMLNGPNNYGARCRTADGAEELFCILGVWRTDDQGLPEFSRGMLSTVVHEFCHSYANAIVDRHSAELQGAGEKIFPLVAGKMKSQAYGNWRTMLYESLVRACVLRYARRYEGALPAWWAVRQQKARGFAWIDELSELLGDYEQHRDRYPSLEAFSPRLIAFFDEYAEKFAGEQSALSAKRPKVVSVIPADGARDVDPGLGAIRVVFDRPMKNDSWSMCGGGPNFPETVGKPGYDEQRTTWTVRVKLKPDWSYQFTLNSAQFRAFQSQEGVPLDPVEITFKTAREKPVRK